MQCVCACVYVPSQDRPWEVTPGSASLQTLQKVGLACEQAYQLCIPEKCSILNWLAWGVGRRNIEVETRQHFSTQEETQKDKNENFPGTTIKKNN